MAERMLEVQKYLSQKTLQNLREEFAIHTDEDENLVLLNYSQVDSPKMHPIVAECRGLILEKNTWNIVSFPFRRFFNYFEIPETITNFNFSNAIALEKIDGSLISLFNYKNEWRIATRNKLDAKGEVNPGLTFNQLFHKTVERYTGFWDALDKDRAYYFELVSPENRIVTLYNERELYLLIVRSGITWEELSNKQVEKCAQNLGVRFPKQVSFNDKDGIIKMANSLNMLKEGFVVVDYTTYDTDSKSFFRIKIKNEGYVIIHHLKTFSGRSVRGLLHLVMTGEDDEFLSYFPEFKKQLGEIRTKYLNFVNKIETEALLLQKYFIQERTIENRKLFAEKAMKTTLTAFMFELYDNKVKDLKEYFEKMRGIKSDKTIEKSVLSKINIKDVEFFSE